MGDRFIFVFIWFWTIFLVVVISVAPKDANRTGSVSQTIIHTSQSSSKTKYDSGVLEETTAIKTTIAIADTTTEDVTDPVCSTANNDQIEEPYLVLTAEEKKIFATLLRLECGGLSYECQMAVASVVVNRMNYAGASLRQIVFASGQFSPSYLIDYDTGNSHYPPYDINWKVVDDICNNGTTLPEYVMFFRGGHYHSWSTPYLEIDGIFFSYTEDYAIIADGD